MEDRRPASVISVEIVFDPTCPWCYIGKRRLERALAKRPSLTVRLLWRPFLLNPDIPAAGLPRDDYLNRKYGGSARVRRVLRAISDAGQSSRIDFAFDRIRRTPSSVNAHRLVRFADAEGLAHAAVEALFHAYFLFGRDIGDRGVLVDVGAGIGLDPHALGIYLASDADVAFVHREHSRAARLGISGVPTFVMSGNLLIAGAQEPRVLASMLDVAREVNALEGDQIPTCAELTAER